MQPKPRKNVRMYIKCPDGYKLDEGMDARLLSGLYGTRQGGALWSALQRYTHEWWRNTSADNPSQTLLYTRDNHNGKLLVTCIVDGFVKSTDSNNNIHNSFNYIRIHESARRLWNRLRPMVTLLMNVCVLDLCKWSVAHCPMTCVCIALVMVVNVPRMLQPVLSVRKCKFPFQNSTLLIFRLTTSARFR